MDALTAVKTARGMMENGMSLDSANVELVRMMGFRIIQARLHRKTRSALMRGVREGRLKHLAKDGLKPEAFCHPNSVWKAEEERAKYFNAGIRAIQSCCA